MTTILSEAIGQNILTSWETFYVLVRDFGGAKPTRSEVVLDGEEWTFEMVQAVLKQPGTTARGASFPSESREEMEYGETLGLLITNSTLKKSWWIVSAR